MRGSGTEAHQRSLLLLVLRLKRLQQLQDLLHRVRLLLQLLLHFVDFSFHSSNGLCVLLLHLHCRVCCVCAATAHDLSHSFVRL